MQYWSRRAFLGHLGSGVALAGSSSLGWAAGRYRGTQQLDEDALDFGELEDLSHLLQETKADELMGLLVARLSGGLSLERLVGAASLANARMFGGEDYTGYHCAMALVPAFEMAHQIEGKLKPLPLLKVLHRNARRSQANGGRSAEVLHLLPETSAPPVSAKALHDQLQGKRIDQLDTSFSTLSGRPQAMYEAVQRLVQDDIDVHRVVLSWRAWDMIRFTGEEHAHTLLRQSVRHCGEREVERRRQGREPSELRALLPSLLQEHAFGNRDLGAKPADDGWIESMATTIMDSGRTEAAEAVATALAGGIRPEGIGEALSLAATRLLLHDPGRAEEQANLEKPKGSVHGASVGVHASDAAWAWRQISDLMGPRNRAASLIAGAFHTAGQASRVNGEPIPYKQRAEESSKLEGAKLLDALGGSIAEGDQLGASARAWQCAEQDVRAADFFGVLLENAVQEDGALHAEKYFRTAQETCATPRAWIRHEHMVAAARVAASQTGHESPGLAATRELLLG